MENFCTLNEAKFYQFDEHYSFMTEESKEKYPLDFLKGLNTGKTKIDREEAKALYHEIVSSEMLAVVNDGPVKFQDRKELYGKCLAIKGYDFNFPKERIFKTKDGKEVRKLEEVAGFDGKPLGYSLASEKLVACLRKDFHKDRLLPNGKTVNKILKQEFIFTSDVKASFENISRMSNKLLAIKALQPYMTREENSALREEAYKDGVDNYDKVMDLAKEHFGKIEFKPDEKAKEYASDFYIVNNNGEPAWRKNEKTTLKLEEPKITLYQKNILYRNFEANHQDEDSRNAEKQRLDSLSYDEAKKEFGELPIASAQKFRLVQLFGIPEEGVINLNREQANEMIDKVAKKIAKEEVSPEIRAYAEAHHLVEKGQPYTNEQWNKDSYKVPPMNDVTEMVVDLCATELVNYEYRIRAEKEKTFSVLSHGDCIAALTQHFVNIDARNNGPVMDYQLEVLGKDKEYKNWQEAEEAYLDKMYLENFLTKDELVFLKKENTYFTVIPECDFEKLRDKTLDKEERKELVAKVKEKLHATMTEKRCAKVFNSSFPPSGEFVYSPFYCVSYTIHKLVGQKDISSKSFYTNFVEKTSSMKDIKSIALSVMTQSGYRLKADDKKKCSSMKSSIENLTAVEAKEVSEIARAIAYCAPGLVGRHGTFEETYEEVKHCVKDVKLELKAKEQENNKEISEKVKENANDNSKKSEKSVVSRPKRNFTGRGSGNEII